MRRKLTATITALALALTCFAVPVSAASGDNLISRVGKADRYTYVGNVFDLEVYKGKALKDNDIKWTSSNTSIVNYAESDRYDDEMDFKALKAGKVTITATNLKTGGKIKYNLTVKQNSGSKLIARIGGVDRYTYVGNTFDLEVKKGNALKDNDIKWTSSNTSIVNYAESDRYDDEMDFKALKAGKVTITATNLKTGGKIKYNLTVKQKSGSIYISRVGNATKYVEADDDLELRVSKGSGLSNSQIKWTVSNSSKIWFEDGDNYGSSVELETGHKTGTVKVTAHNLKTGGKIYYTVKITPEYDD